LLCIFPWRQETAELLEFSGSLYDFGVYAIPKRDYVNSREAVDYFIHSLAGIIRRRSDGSYRKSNFEFQSRGGQGPSRVIQFRSANLAGIRSNALTIVAWGSKRWRAYQYPNFITSNDSSYITILIRVVHFFYLSECWQYASFYWLLFYWVSLLTILIAI